MCDANGNLIGYEIDVAQLLAVEVWVRIQFVPTGWYLIVPALIEREMDLFFSGIEIAAERNRNINVSDPYSGFATLEVANRVRISGLIVLATFNDTDVAFGARDGTIHEQAVESTFAKAMLQSIDSDCG